MKPDLCTTDHNIDPSTEIRNLLGGPRPPTYHLHLADENQTLEENFMIAFSTNKDLRTYDAVYSDLQH